MPRHDQHAHGASDRRVDDEIVRRDSHHVGTFELKHARYVYFSMASRKPANLDSSRARSHPPILASITYGPVPFFPRAVYPRSASNSVGICHTPGAITAPAAVDGSGCFCMPPITGPPVVAARMVWVWFSSQLCPSMKRAVNSGVKDQQVLLLPPPLQNCKAPSGCSGSAPGLLYAWSMKAPSTPPTLVAFTMVAVHRSWTAWTV